jgi:hypothetical protein
LSFLSGSKEALEQKASHYRESTAHIHDAGGPNIMAYPTNVLELVESGGQRHRSRTRAVPTFKHAAPQFSCSPISQKTQTAPYRGAPSWKCSVYYYWWLYLRHNQNYLDTCANGGNGPCAGLYQDFGNIYGQTFRSWWTGHEHLFAEPRAAALASDNHHFGDGAKIIDVQIDLSLGAEAVERSLKELHAQLLFPKHVALYRSAAIYPVARRPVLMNLHRHLAVYKWRKRCPDLDDEEIADRVGLNAAEQANGISRSYMQRLGYSTHDIDIELRRAKRKAVQHDLRCARQLIDGVGRGEFPVRTIG